MRRPCAKKIRDSIGTKSPISGKGKLTEKIIDSMQNFYGLVIRQNCESLYQMKKAIGAILWHCTKFDKDDDKNENEGGEYRHRFCPQGVPAGVNSKNLNRL